jgi:hypothetical protein
MKMMSGNDEVFMAPEPFPFFVLNFDIVLVSYLDWISSGSASEIRIGTALLMALMRVSSVRFLNLTPYLSIESSSFNSLKARGQLILNPDVHIVGSSPVVF